MLNSVSSLIKPVKIFEPGGFLKVLDVFLVTNRELQRNDRLVQNSGPVTFFIFLRGMTSKKNFLNISTEKKVIKNGLKKKLV